MRQDRWFFAECLACLKHLYYLCAIQMDRYARGAAPMGCALAQGGSRGRAGSSWFLSLRLRLAINVFSCIFSNGVMRNAPVSHKLMCRWSYPLYIYLTDVHPRNTYPHVPIQQGCRDILSSPDEYGHSSCPLSPGGVTKRTACKGDRLVTAGWALMIKYFRTYVF